MSLSTWCIRHDQAQPWSSSSHLLQVGKSEMLYPWLTGTTDPTLLPQTRIPPVIYVHDTMPISSIRRPRRLSPARLFLTVTYGGSRVGCLDCLSSGPRNSRTEPECSSTVGRHGQPSHHTKGGVDHAKIRTGEPARPGLPVQAEQRHPAGCQRVCLSESRGRGRCLRGRSVGFRRLFREDRWKFCELGL